MDDLDLELSDAAFEAASRRGEEERTKFPSARSARFDRESGRVVVEFDNGAAFMVPARQLEGLEDASDLVLSEVELLGETGLHWESRNVDYRIAGLMEGIFGSARYMEAARRRGGLSRSPSKVAAARANGQKGGRPRTKSTE